MLLVFLLVWWLFSALADFSSEFYSQNFEPLSKVIESIRKDEVKKVEIKGEDLKIYYNVGETKDSIKEPNQNFLELLANYNIDPAKIPDGVATIPQLPIWEIIGTVAPLVLMLVFLFFILRQARGAAGDVFSFGKSRAKVFLKGSKNGKEKISFKDVAGAEEVKKELTEVMDFLKNPDKYKKIGARIPKGVLLIGPSGVGKTLLARAIAGEANVPFFSAAGSEFMEMLVGVGSARMRDLFSTAKSAQPAVIFIDEIDAIGRQRGMAFSAGHDEREQTLNQLLVEMDGFDQRVNVIVLAATNRPDLLDPALIRPGRFDRRVTLELPDVNEREEIFKIHMRGKPFSEDLNIKRIAQQTVGFSGADIENMLNEGAIFAARNERDKITMRDLMDAATKVKLGPERKRLQSEEEKTLTAYHEAGHALAASKLPSADPVQRVSIISRSYTLGFTDISPQRDRYNETKTRLLGFITISLAGRAAEELVYKEETVGAANDIEKATQIAKKMVCEFGMSSLGPILYGGGEEKRWLAFQLGEKVSYSEEMAKKIDNEVKKIVDGCFKEAKDILQKNRKVLDNLAKELVIKETLEKEDIDKILGL
ncbi:cell division protein FtsH [candidate division WWE3 bacterium CG10_big_fil_rev_8_21_14_0_10_39_14]|nr:MAG: cell division protein FtsH [candidate division WWE3 bacterium CG10_big_fil_rev_8_21_14_0_10_39_14]